MRSRPILTGGSQRSQHLQLRTTESRILLTVCRSARCRKLSDTFSVEAKPVPFVGIGPVCYPGGLVLSQSRNC